MITLRAAIEWSVTLFYQPLDLCACHGELVARLLQLLQQVRVVLQRLLLRCQFRQLRTQLRVLGLQGFQFGRLLRLRLSLFAQFGSDLMREGSDAGVNAVRAANRGALADGSSATAMRDALLPKHKTAAPADMEAALISYGRGVENGLTDANARQTAATELIQAAAARGQTLKPKTARNQVDLIVERYQEANRVPLQLHELPAMRDGSRGTESNWTMRAAMNRQSDEADAFRSGVSDRQVAMGDELIGAVERGAGGSAGDDALIAAREALKVRNRATYKAAEDADEAARIAIGQAPGAPPPGGGNLPTVRPGVTPIDLSKEISTMHLRHQGRQGATSKGMIEAVEALTEEMPSGPTCRRGPRGPSAPPRCGQP